MADPFGQPWPLVLAPGALVIAALLLFGRLWPWRPGVILTVWGMAAFYLQWRIGVTVDWGAPPVERAWMALVLAIECLALFDALILHLILWNPTDRSAEADAHEARLRTADAGRLPSVDVFIATYNEPPEVLEKTILGALALDWPDARVWVLDDGRRPWLRDYCRARGAGWITRPDNRGAKAGNINHALGLTRADYVAVFDADFVPARQFLMRTMGFFADPRVGIVQVPHAFYNHDPLQANLGLRRSVPDDQRFFFESILPGRDRWNAAFCCGSNSVTRRALFRAVGGGLPEGSITEDMLLTLAALRHGYVTRYLNEPLAHGLAPESVAAFFVQRERWARGGIQILHLKEGPLGPGLSLVHRLMFLPTHYLTQSLALLLAILAPILFLLTGLAPLTNVTVEGVVQRLLPFVLAMVAGIAALAPGRYYPTAAQVMALFQAFRILPVALQTLVRPHGIPFRVTPKGRDAAGGVEWGVLGAALLLAALTVIGLGLNARPDFRIVEQAALVPMVAFWCAVNLLLLALVVLLCLQMPARRAEERFLLDGPSLLARADGAVLGAVRGDISLSGLGADTAFARALTPGEAVRVRLDGVGWLPGRVTRVAGDRVGIAFDPLPAGLRDRLVVRLYASGLIREPPRPDVWRATAALIGRLAGARMEVADGLGGAAEQAPLPQAPAAPEERLPPATRVERPRPGQAEVPLEHLSA